MSKLTPAPTPYTEIQTQRVLDEHTDPALAPSGSPDGSNDVSYGASESTDVSSTEEMDLCESNNREMEQSLPVWLRTEGEHIFRREAQQWLGQFGPNLLAVHIITERKAVPKPPTIVVDKPKKK